MKNPFLLFLNEFLQTLSYRRGWTWNAGQCVLYNIESTNACPMTCRMCPRRHMTRPIRSIDPLLFARLLAEGGGWTEFLWLDHFGDPLLYPDLPSLIRITHTYSIRVGFSTNPPLLTPERGTALLEAGLDWIHLSLDGIDAETYRFYRGEAADYEKAIRYIDRFVEEKLQKKLTKPKIIVAMIRMKKTEPQWEAFLQRWSRPGIDRVILKTFSSFSGIDPTLEEYGNDQRSVPPVVPCFFPWSSLTVLSDGRVVPCCYDFDGIETLGDATRESLPAIWNGEAMRRFRAIHLQNAAKDHPLCKNCKDRRLPWTFRDLICRTKARLPFLQPSGDLWIVYQ